MTKLHVITLALVAITNVACSKKEETKTEETSEKSEKSEKAAKPKQAEVPCKDDQYKKEKDGKIQSCILEKEFDVGQYRCEDKKIAYFYPDGTLKDCYLAKAKDIDGFNCKDGVSLYPDGKLKRCKLEKGKTADDIELRKGDWLTLHKSGSLKRIEFLGAGPGKIDGKSCAGSMNYLHENGKLKKCQLAEDTKIDGKTMKKDEFVCFDDKGKKVEDCKMLSWSDAMD